MSLMPPGVLQLPANQQLRSVVLSYLLYHGHKDTARVFAAEIARREVAESIERCPLWQPRDSSSGVDSHGETPGNAVDSALGHISQPEHDADDRPSNTTTSLPRSGPNNAQDNEGTVPYTVLVDVEARRKIRHKILSGRIEDAIALIAHHLPEFLPLDSPGNGIQPAEPKPQSGSHDPSVHTSNMPSSPVLAPSRSPTPVSSPSKATTVPEKASQKTDAPVPSASESGSPRIVDSDEPQAPAHCSRNPNSPILGRSVDPIHILFNLRVQQFVEAVRTVPLLPSTEEQTEVSLMREMEPAKLGETNVDVEMHSPDSEPVVPTDGDQNKLPKQGASILHVDTSSEARQKHLFQLASGLYQNVKTLACATDRDIYAKEVEQVCSLMLGPSPETSLAAPYLSMSRREALADQVNSAMLWHVGEPPAPRLQIWAQTARVVWDQVIAMRPTLQKATDVPADVRMYAKYVTRNAEGDEEQGQPLAAVPFDFHALAQA